MPAPDPAGEVDVREPQGDLPRREPRRAEAELRVALHAAAALGPHVDMRPKSGERTRQPDCPAHGSHQRQTREARPQAVERQRIRGHVGEDAQRFSPQVEPHGAADGACGALAVAVAQRAAELGVAIRSGEGPRRVEHAVQRHRRREPPHRPQVHGRRFDAESPERQATGQQVHVAVATQPRLGPPGHERVPEAPVHLEGQPAEGAFGPRVAREPAVEREAVEERVREAQVQIARLHVGLAQRHEARIRGAHGGEPPRQPAAAVAEIERIDMDFQQAPAM